MQLHIYATAIRILTKGYLSISLITPLKLKEILNEVRNIVRKTNTDMFWSLNLDFIENNYRPVSNLQFIGKLIERAVNNQLQEHIASNNLMEPMQSAYRAGHSTEMALIKVKADLLNAIDNKEVVCLVLLDLSAAFDTVDHQILLDRLKYMFGFTGLVFNWIASYLSSRSQKVVVDHAKSPSTPLSFRVPQGSILGPILFTLYQPPLGKSAINMALHIICMPMISSYT